MNTGTNSLAIGMHEGSMPGGKVTKAICKASLVIYRFDDVLIEYEMVYRSNRSITGGG